MRKCSECGIEIVLNPGCFQCTVYFMKNAKKLLKQIKRQAIKVQRPATRAVAGLRAPRPLRRTKLIKFK